MNDRVFELAQDVWNEARTWQPDLVDPDDLGQELHEYALRKEKLFVAWISGGEDHRVRLALRGAAKQHVGQVRAEAAGYQFEDQAWYTPQQLAGLMPLVLDDRWANDDSTDQEPGMPGGAGLAREGGGLLAAVVDVRRVVSPRHWQLKNFDPETESGMSNLTWVADRLGGAYPEAPGYGRGRAARPNSAAIAETRDR